MNRGSIDWDLVKFDIDRKLWLSWIRGCIVFCELAFTSDLTFESVFQNSVYWKFQHFSSIINTGVIQGSAGNSDLKIFGGLY